jgi:hypothetical protein
MSLTREEPLEDFAAADLRFLEEEHSGVRWVEEYVEL